MLEAKFDYSEHRSFAEEESRLLVAWPWKVEVFQKEDFEETETASVRFNLSNSSQRLQV